MKPRSDSLHATLSSSQCEELTRLLCDGAAYREVLEWLDAECHVKSSLGAISNFYRKHVVPLLEERRQFAAAQAEAILSTAGEVDWDAATSERLKQIAFRELNREGADVESVKTLMTLMLKGVQVRNEGRRIDLLERKANMADQAKAVSDDDALTPEEKAQRMKQIFRMG